MITILALYRIKSRALLKIELASLADKLLQVCSKKYFNCVQVCIQFKR